LSQASRVLLLSVLRQLARTRPTYQDALVPQRQARMLSLTYFTLT